MLQDAFLELRTEHCEHCYFCLWNIVRAELCFVFVPDSYRLSVAVYFVFVSNWNTTQLVRGLVDGTGNNKQTKTEKKKNNNNYRKKKITEFVANSNQLQQQNSIRKLR